TRVVATSGRRAEPTSLTLILRKSWSHPHVRNTCPGYLQLGPSHGSRAVAAGPRHRPRTRIKRDLTGMDPHPPGRLRPVAGLRRGEQRPPDHHHQPRLSPRHHNVVDHDPYLWTTSEETRIHIDVRPDPLTHMPLPRNAPTCR